MKALYLRVWITVVAVLALFALGTGWLAQHHVTQERQRLGEERQRIASQSGDRVRALGDLLGQALPDAQAPAAEQAQVLLQWSERLRIPVALDDAQGRRLAASASYERRMAEGMGPPPVALLLEDGRTLWLMRGPRGGPRERMGERAGERAGEREGERASERSGEGADRGPPGAALPPPNHAPLLGWAMPWWSPDPWRSGGSLLALLGLLFVAVALGAYPVVRGLTRRLESLQRGVERFGAGALGHRVDEDGRDEIARLASSFNHAAQRIEVLVQSHSRLVAHASHELRSPLARLKLALGLLEEARDEAVRARLRREISHNLRELDELIEEMLLSSRLQADQRPASSLEMGEIDLLAVVAEEASRSGAEVIRADAVPLVRAEERLIRRAVRNLLENARRYGQGAVEVVVATQASDVEVQVLDRGPGVPASQAERIFEPFYRLPGHAESEGGVGLGLALVRQIAQHHGGTVRVIPRDGGGSCFSLSLPIPRAHPAHAGE